MSERVVLMSTFKCSTCENAIPTDDEFIYDCKLKAEEWFNCVIKEKDYYIKKEESNG